MVTKDIIKDTSYGETKIFVKLSATGHFGHKTFRTRTRHFGTGAEMSQDTSASDREKSGHFGTGIRLKLGAEVSRCFGAELSGHFRTGTEVSGHFDTNFVVPKCLGAEVSGSHISAERFW